MTTSIIILSLRILFSLLLGMLLGMERTLAGKRAGLRTFGLVSMGSTLFVVISILAYQDLNMEYADIFRVVAAIITGMGFLGAGLIVFKRGSVVGLTTAAGLWVASAIGIGVGFGYYIITLVALLLTLVTFRLLLIFEDTIKTFVHDEDSSNNNSDSLNN